MINLLELTRTVYDTQSKLVGYKVDSVFIKNPTTTEVDEEKYRIDNWNPIQYKEFKVRDMDISLPETKPWNNLKDIQYNFTTGQYTINNVKVSKKMAVKYLNELKDMSFMCSGMAGCQKSTLLKKLFDPNDSMILCFQNSTCQCC